MFDRHFWYGVLCVTLLTIAVLMTQAKAQSTTTPLPEFHPSELFITVAQHAWADGSGRSWLLMRGGSNNSGIALRGKAYTKVAAVERETPIIKEMREEIATGFRAANWTAKSGREYLAFNLDAREPPRKIPIISAAGVR